ncbi:MAG: PIN domain-containing protein [Cyanobacteria bacterium J06639_14]
MVKNVLFDTSSLVATFLEDHPLHVASINWFQATLNDELKGYVSTHTLAELYAVLTRMPRQPRLSPLEVEQLMCNLTSFEKVALSHSDYVKVIGRLVKLNLTGGVIYDALIAQAALVAEVETLLTANSKDFLRLGEDVAAIVQPLLAK